MLAGGLDVMYRNLLAGPHRPLSYLQVWRDGVRIDTYGDDGLPFFDGSVSATLTSQVTRQLNFTTTEELYPVFETDLLAPYGNEIRAWRGVESGIRNYVWQVFRGRIDDVAMEPDGSANINCVDRAAAVKDSGFLAPENSQVGDLVVDEFRRIINGGVSDATFGTFDAISTVTPQLSWESDRSGACDDLATAAGSFWYALANGDYVMRFIPWAVDQASLLTFTDGDGGTLASAVPTRSREDVFNVVTVTGERADGTDPVFARAMDLDPTSVTYVNGPFGVRAKLVQLQAVVTQSQALSVAKTALHQAKSRTQSWELVMTPDAALELGDAITVQARGLPPDQQVVQSFSLPLSGDGQMSVSLRQQQVGLTMGSVG
jgi:hypothetical protein